MRVLICGGRNYLDYEGFSRAVNMFIERFGAPTVIIEGGAKGADAMAKYLAISEGIHLAEVRALWDKHGKKAGHLRNTAMLSLAEYVIAFPGGAGTRDMVEQAKEAGVPVWEPYPTT
jgi:hypothetical protein